MAKKSIYIVQTFSGTILSRMIRIITKYEYCHVMIATDKSFEKLYSFGRRTPFNPLNSGFIIETIDGKFFSTFKETKCRVYRIEVSQRKYNKVIKLIKKYEEDPLKYSYDIIGLILKLFKIYIRRENHYVCSQFVAEIITGSKIYDFNKPLSAVEPRDFDNITNTIEYIGKLRNYHNRENDVIM